MFGLFLDGFAYEFFVVVAVLRNKIISYVQFERNFLLSFIRVLDVIYRSSNWTRN